MPKPRALNLDALLESPDDCAIARHRIAVRFCVDDATGCHVWTGPAGGRPPRARFVLRQQSNYAYRVAWVIEKGPIPRGLFVCHRCDNPLCINVEHLFLGTHADNMRDMAIKGRARTPSYEDRSEVPGTKYPAALVCEALRSLASGVNAATLARRIGCDASTVRFWQRTYGSSCPSCTASHCAEAPTPAWSRQYGELSPRHRLTDAQVSEIRRRFDQPDGHGGRSNAGDLAAEFGVSKTYLTRIAKGERRPRATPREGAA